MDVDVTAKPGGSFGREWCSSPHPTKEGAYCRRYKGHKGKCKAFVLSIVQPDEWANPNE